MSFSMTGYGQSSLLFGGYKITFEVKSVNHRYSEIVLRMPREWTCFEDVLRRTVQQHIKRGRVDVTINREQDEEDTASGPVLNIPTVRSYLKAADELKREFGLTGELSLRDMLALHGVMENGEGTVLEPVVSDSWQATLVEGLEQSVHSLLQMRAREGSYLTADLELRLAKLEQLHYDMLELAPSVVSEYRDKLRQRLNELNDGTFPFDEHKFGMEIAIFADRCNIDEELTRLFSHIEQCRTLLRGNEPVGRKMDFLIQEMNRETNTIGSKSNHLTLVNRALEMKAELEKIREQAANLE
ncbi:YicC/YloC family endoribonuclease [Paenibacillus wynnii]|uniref:Stress-induced protein n=1 Tax=Paenibacillus wynnii TaxID=268407 RepID=A0A098M2S6_9BACL|nr:YicC/YloC family endoribonuclease [Paenibacillus wynnii]KGE16710.1 stress-induced protein [Paenibacillus wynnii]